MTTHDKYETDIFKNFTTDCWGLEKIEKKMTDGQKFSMEKHLFGEPFPWINESKED